jgi:hypothetical protein
MDAESGFYYLLARYYAPSIGQFLSVDPLVEETQAPYAYVDDDPINADDLTGSACSGIGCLVSAVSDVAKTVVETVENPCLRDPFAGGANSTTFDGCEAELTPVEGGVGVSIGAAILSGGAAAGAELSIIGLDAAATGYVGAVIGAGSTALDIQRCRQGDTPACIAIAPGALSVAVGLLPALGIEGVDDALAARLSFGFGALAAGIDTGAWLGGLGWPGGLTGQRGLLAC